VRRQTNAVGQTTRMSGDTSVRIHATLVAIDREDGAELGAMFLGPPGSGKSDLALRLIHDGALLVADDQVDVSFGKGGLWGAAPANIAGLIEARGIGLLRLPFAPGVRIAAVFDLTPGAAIERMPEKRWYQPPQTFRARGGALRIPLYALNAFEPSAPAKVTLSLLGKVEG
jgi:HPr kinase/phosphorylase